MALFASISMTIIVLRILLLTDYAASQVVPLAEATGSNASTLTGYYGISLGNTTYNYTETDGAYYNVPVSVATSQVVQTPFGSVQGYALSNGVDAYFGVPFGNKL